MLKVLAGDWKQGNGAFVQKTVGGIEALHIMTGIFSHETIPVTDIASFDIVTETNKTTIMGKVGWGAVGAFALGPLGLLAGVVGGGNKNERVMAFEFRDGRRVLLKGNAKEAEKFTAIMFNNEPRNVLTIEAETVEPDPVPEALPEWANVDVEKYRSPENVRPTRAPATPARTGPVFGRRAT